MRAYLAAFLWLLIMWVLILLSAVSFYKIKKTAAYLLVPHLAWVAFAGVLNYSIYYLNR